MDTIPVSVSSELESLAMAIAPQVKTSLLNIKNEFRRSGLALDDGFKHLLLEFLNERYTVEHRDLFLSNFWLKFVCSKENRKHDQFQTI